MGGARVFRSGWGWVGDGVGNTVYSEGAEVVEGFVDAPRVNVRHVQKPEVYWLVEDECGGRGAGELESEVAVRSGGADAEVLQDDGWCSALAVNNVRLPLSWDLDDHHRDPITTEKGPVTIVGSKTRRESFGAAEVIEAEPGVILLAELGTLHVATKTLVRGNPINDRLDFANNVMVV